MADNNSDRVDIYSRVTNTIVTAIEAGAESWEMPWHASKYAGLPVNAMSGKYYRGVNVLTFWIESHLKGYTSPTWATYNQWQDLGKQVARGQKSAMGVFWKRLEERGEQNDDDEPEAEGDGCA